MSTISMILNTGRENVSILEGSNGLRADKKPKTGLLRKKCPVAARRSQKLRLTQGAPQRLRAAAQRGNGLFTELSMVFLSNSCTAPGVCHEPAVGAKFHHALMAPQHFLYFLPLPHGHGLFLPIFSDLTAWVGFKALSKAEISSGLSNSKPIIKCHPFFSHVSATYFALSSD